MWYIKYLTISDYREVKGAIFIKVKKESRNYLVNRTSQVSAAKIHALPHISVNLGEKGQLGDCGPKPHSYECKGLSS